MFIHFGKKKGPQELTLIDYPGQGSKRAGMGSGLEAWGPAQLPSSLHPSDRAFEFCASWSPVAGQNLRKAVQTAVFQFLFSYSTDNKGKNLAFVVMGVEFRVLHVQG